MNRGSESTLRCPARTEGTLTRGAALTRRVFRVVVEGEARGLVDLRCAPGERLPPDLELGEKLKLALELERSILEVEGRVSARSGSTLQIALSGKPTELPRRRRYTRVRINQDTTIRVERDDGRVLTVPAKIVDLSQGGCSLRVDVVVSAHVAITVEAELPVRVTLPGRVIRAGGGEGVPGTIGVRFDELPGALQATLQQFLHDHRRRYVA